MANPTPVTSVKFSQVSTTSSVTTTAMTGSGSNTLLIVDVWSEHTTSGVTAPSNVRWGGSGGTELTKIYDSGTVGTFWNFSKWALVAPATGSNTIYCLWGSSMTAQGVAGTYIQDAAQSSPTVTSSSGTSTSPSDTATTVSGNLVVDGMFWGRNSGGSFTATVDASQTSLQEIEGAAFDYGGGGRGGLCTSYEAATGSSTVMSWTLSGAPDAWRATSAVVTQAATVDQAAFRFGDDDGSESTYTQNTQDANKSVATATNFMYRAQLQAVDDPSALAFTLYAQKNGAGGYTAVPVGASSSPTLSWGAAGTIAYSSSGGTSVAPTYPTGITTKSCLVLVVGQKPSSANGGTMTTPSGWTLQGQNTGATDGDTGGYTTTLGADTGNTNIYICTKDTVSGSESGTLSVTVGTNGVCWANIYRIESSDDCTWSYACGVGKDTSAGNVSIATGSMAIAAGDHILAGMVIPTDVTTPSQFSSEALSQSGTTFGSVSEIEEPDSTTGNDIGGFLCQAGVSSGSGSGAATLTATAGGTTTNVRGPGFVFRARATAVNREIYVSTSANVTAGGEATTNRMTGGTGSFVTGRIWDNENGTDTLDITSNNFTQVAWCCALGASLSGGDYFDLRVYKGSSPLDAYTATGRVTVSGAVAGTASITEGADTVASTATVVLAATLSKTEADDTSSATCTVQVVGTLSKTEDDDTVAATIVPTGVVGTLSVTEEDDSVSSATIVAIAGTFAVTGDSDTTTATGVISLSGTASITEADDTSSASGIVAITGVASSTEEADTVAATAALVLLGALFVTQDDDTLSADGTLSLPGRLGTLSVTEDDDSVAASATISITGAVTVTEADDAVTASCSVSGYLIDGNLSYTINSAYGAVTLYNSEGKYYTIGGVS